MNQIGKKLGIIFFLLLWLFLLSLPALAFILAAQGQIQIGNEGNNHLRIFLLQERSAEGVGFELVRPISVDLPCSQTTIRYLMWEGEPENVTFCHCLDLQTGSALPATSGRCVLP
jgi:hypothetical protein